MTIRRATSLTFSNIGVAVAVVAIIGLAVVGKLAPVNSGASEVGTRSTTITVDGGDGVRVVIPQEDIAASAVEALQIDLPIGRPTILATYAKSDNKLVGLAMSTADGRDVEVNATSTAASLVALSPSVLTASSNWMGVVGHLVATPEFDALVRSVSQTHSLDAPELKAALNAVLAALKIPEGVECAIVCAQRTAEGSAAVIQNATLSRLLATDASGEVCGWTAAAELVPAERSAAIGTDATAGRLNQVVALEPIGIRVSTSLTHDPPVCSKPLRIVNGGASEPAGQRALWSTTVNEYFAPLLGLLEPKVSINSSSLDSMAAVLAGGTSTLKAEIAARGVSELTTSFAMNLDSILHPGGFDPARLGSIAIDLPTNPIPVAVAPTTTTTTTLSPTTSPPTLPPVTAPPDTVRTTTVTSVIKTVTRLEVSLSMAVAPPEPPWEVSATFRNTGQSTLEKAQISCSIVGAAGASTPSKRSMAELGQTGSLAPNASFTAKLTFDISQSSNPDTMVCSHPALDSPIRITLS